MDDILNAIKYTDILDNNLWPVVIRHFFLENYLFQDDNGLVNRARTVDAFKDNKYIPCLPWPAQSPFVNAIENVWLKLKRRLQARVEHIRTRDELFAAIQDIWENLDVKYIKSLYLTIPKRLQEGIKAKGHLTKY